jgi:hypothetical protein
MKAMTVFFWRGRPSRKLIATLLFFTVLVTVFFFRHIIIVKSIEYFAKPYDLNVTCLKFSFDWKLNLTVKQACITSPISTVEVNEAIWQLGSNFLSIQQIKIKHLKHLFSDKEVHKQLLGQRQQVKINLPDSLPFFTKLHISRLEIDSYELLQPLNLSVNSVSGNELNIAGDVNASVKMYPNSLLVNITWKLSDLTKWISQVKNHFQDNRGLLKDLTSNESNIKTNLTFDGKVINLDSHLDMVSRIYISKCPIDAIIKGDLLVDVDISRHHISLDLNQLSSDVSVDDCPLLQDYFAADNLPLISFAFPQKITINKTQINLPELHILDKQNTERSIIFDTLNYKKTGELQLKGTINSSDMKMGSVNIAKISSDFSLSGESVNDLKLIIDNQISQLDYPDFSVQNVTNHMDMNITELETLNFSGESAVTNLVVQNINLLPVTVSHKGQANLVTMTLSSQHDIQLKQGFLVELEQHQTNLEVHINQQNIINLQNIISQMKNAMTVTQGKLSANIIFTLPQEDAHFPAQGKAYFYGVSLKYQDYRLNNMTYQTPLTFDSAGLQLDESTLHIDSIDAGVTLQQIKANVIAKNSILRLTQVQGNIFNGEFLLGDLWLDGREQQFNINIQNIDLAQVVALQKQPGIKITGKIDGDMPFIIGKQGIRVDNGWVSNLTGGKLTIIDNPSFDSIKLQQPKLALLENLEYTQLESNVKFTPDGWVFFDFALQGNNPDKKQSVNFNYSHQENIFSLLESIRLVKSIENKIEQKIIQGDKK